MFTQPTFAATPAPLECPSNVAAAKPLLMMPYGTTGHKTESSIVALGISYLEANEHAAWVFLNHPIVVNPNEDSFDVLKAILPTLTPAFETAHLFHLSDDTIELGTQSLNYCTYYSTTSEDLSSVAYYLSDESANDNQRTLDKPLKQRLKMKTLKLLASHQIGFGAH